MDGVIRMIKMITMITRMAQELGQLWMAQMDQMDPDPRDRLISHATAETGANWRDFD